MPTPSERDLLTAERRPMNSTRKTARIAGWLFVITFVTSIPELFLYEPLLKHTNYIFGSGAHPGVALGATLEIFLAISGIGTAVVLYPILKRQSQSMSLGYVASRTLESTIIVVGIVSVLTVVTLRHDVGGPGAANGAALVFVERSLVAIHDWTFLLGPRFCAGFGNGVLLGYLMYKSRLVPRGMAMLGLIGGPLIFASGIAIVFGAYKDGSAAATVTALPEIAWEAVLGIYLVIKGFKPSPLISVNTELTRVDDSSRIPAVTGS
jgi:Domain of unknown function (DUF4386)